MNCQMQNTNQINTIVHKKASAVVKIALACMHANAVGEWVNHGGVGRLYSKKGVWGLLFKELVMLRHETTQSMSFNTITCQKVVFTKAVFLVSRVAVLW